MFDRNHESAFIHTLTLPLSDLFMRSPLYLALDSPSAKFLQNLKHYQEFIIENV